MGGKGTKNTYYGNAKSTTAVPVTTITSIIDKIVPGREYESILNLFKPGINVDINMAKEFQIAIDGISAIRQRPVICYIANVGNDKLNGSRAIDASDDLPFAEMVSSVPSEHKEIDVLIVTPGGSGDQVARFVNHLRPRFEKVTFIIPNVAMSAGTILAMSGDDIIMDSRATIGPIDPQVLRQDGSFAPAQSILTVIKEIQERGQRLIDAGKNPLWTDLQVLNKIDAKEIGIALNGSKFSIELVADYLYNYKFKNWTVHSTGIAVTDAEKKARSKEVAEKLCDHGEWKTHSRGITREVAWEVCKIKITHPESIEGLDQAIRRFWAFLYWSFESTQIYKMFISKNYTIFKTSKPTS
ncbi:SDH family Clp fold serine proteinase [Pedobacter panaciterrae]|uniref:SDH family Clp fold serine proteinase n=1 Tax=Pedobacter panaciterrae TaxID=363849 RepID=UPI0025922DB2|nr:hypothetical protein [uncultured Pedobacter sp.]